MLACEDHARGIATMPPSGRTAGDGDGVGIRLGREGSKNRTSEHLLQQAAEIRRLFPQPS
jgi:hypothetical protein